MPLRLLFVALTLAPMLLVGQLSPNAITVSVSQATNVAPSQVTFSLVVTAGLNKTLDQVVGALSGLGITAANLTGLRSAPAVQSDAQSQPTLSWIFQLTAPFSQQTQIAGTLASLQGTVGQNNSGLSLSFTLGGAASMPSSQNCNLATLVANARTQAQSLANAAGLSAGAIVGITSPISVSPSLACSMKVNFGLNSASFQPTVNMITIGASQANTLPLDQATIVISVISGLTASLDDITAALQAAGITGASFTGVSATSAAYLSNAPVNLPSLDWTFTLAVPLTKLNATLTQLTNGAQPLQQQSSGLSLTFSVAGLSSSQAQQPPSCPDATLMTAVQTQAQQVAAAASLALGPIQAISNGQNAGGALPAFVVETGTLSAVLSTSPVSGLGNFIQPSPAPLCSIWVQYQLLY